MILFQSADVRSGGSLDASLNAYMLAYRLSVKGWALLDLRGGVGPTQPIRGR